MTMTSSLYPQEKLLGHLGVVLYEYLGEEYPEVLGSILGGLKVGCILIMRRKILFQLACNPLKSGNLLLLEGGSGVCFVMRSCHNRYSVVNYTPVSK